MSNEVLGIVIDSSPLDIVIEVQDVRTFEKNKSFLQVGQYIKILDGNSKHIISSISNVKAIHQLDKDNNPYFRFNIHTQPVGVLNNDGNFKRGNMTLPVPTEPAYIVSESDMYKIFNGNGSYNFQFGKLIQNNEINLMIDGNKFFSKHVGVVGSTGSGKSSTVAKLLQKSVGIEDNMNTNKEDQKNSHIIIFDIHSEYASAFFLREEEKFNLNILDVNNIKLPYWLMNSEELEDMFIESNESNSHNQVSQFRRAVILNKKKYNPDLNDLTYDTPVYFSMEEVCKYIENLNNEMISKLEGENLPKLTNGELISDRVSYFEDLYEFVPQSTAKADKASGGPYYGEFNRFILRLKNKIEDKRLSFLFQSPKQEDDKFEDIIKQFIGYLDKSNISIVDLSGIPFEVLSITVSLISRVVFDFSFHYSKIRHSDHLLNDVPIMIVCEEAHIYVPNNTSAQYRSSKKSIERIAKEGRKYGLSLMVVSQRPSEVSETIFAQCNNFIALRLTNYNDQNYIRRLLPDTSNGVANILPNLSSGEFIMVGDAVIIPSVAKEEMPNPAPKSQSVDFHNEWQKSWVGDLGFKHIIERWTGK
ncbi:ATP-binding protein (plasmid) [Alkalihalobacillus hwajinpoensis]|uniref:ATP-binding protein n=1 Tax=Guptibacillus hwajinpoensis TaxID=208199 RepID=UPI0018847233|nr:ATP-binding protein [Pseudalkalibacillus hwajinpoensis]MBF0706718.1 ATP-binding protein [Pseudalkalibacillus hwajinpoensis]